MRRLALLALALPLVGCDDAPAPKQAKTRPILNQRTQDIKDAPAEVKSGAAVLAPDRPIAKDPITLVGNAYVTAIGRISIDNIKHTVDLYQAEKGEYPKDHKQFMDEIIKANNIALPTLPYYQEYSYDAKNHRLLILEYPDRKAAGGPR